MASCTSGSLSAGAILLSVLLALPASGADLSERVGIVHRGEVGNLRLTIARDSLAPGSRIAIVTMPEGMVLCCAVSGTVYVPPADEFDPIYLDHDGKTTYSLDAAGLETEVTLGFGLVAAVDGERPDIDGDGRPDAFRSCASGEGLHMTVWTDEPLKSTRLWHAYVYLGYDTESDCAAQDYE